ncbi:putative leader peptide [Streptacidiphilus sp. N1-12]|uniref:Leader peptide n=2 Tax=Streptacidiphilus alkalitolerans TaxID=3342712 RepID=A0ABV6VIG3_9ACTN
MREQRPSGTPRPYGSFRLRVARRHVDLLRVSSALCPGSCPVR